MKQWWGEMEAEVVKTGPDNSPVSKDELSDNGL